MECCLPLLFFVINSSTTLVYHGPWGVECTKAFLSISSNLASGFVITEDAMTLSKEGDGNFDPEHPPYNPFVVNLVAWLSLIGIILSGLFWYFREN